MSERRQAFRREPIEVGLSEDKFISVGPVAWERRNDFGNEIMRQHVEIINEGVKLYVDPDIGLPQLEAKLTEKFNDPDALLRLGLTDEVYAEVKAITPLYHNQIVAILMAACEVNDLVQLIPMIDPNSQTPMTIGTLLSNLASGEETTPKTESGPDSSSTDSVETTSGNSPSQSLVPSSTKSPEELGTNATGL
jgi:hypothetical protein